jgi:hypothetical protein
MLPPPPGVTKANFDFIEVGMALTEVERIFGHAGHQVAVRGDEQRKTIFWTETPYNGDVAIITFSNYLACDKQWGGGSTFLDKLRRWLHLPKWSKEIA